jgi:hypothetical protein
MQPSIIALQSRSHADFIAGCDTTEVPCTGCTEGAGSAECVFRELNVADFVARHLGEQREGRSNLDRQAGASLSEKDEIADANKSGAAMKTADFLYPP